VEARARAAGRNTSQREWASAMTAERCLERCGDELTRSCVSDAQVCASASIFRLHARAPRAMPTDTPRGCCEYQRVPRVHHILRVWPGRV
jgi:hypothetical protein